MSNEELLMSNLKEGENYLCSVIKFAQAVFPLGGNGKGAELIPSSPEPVAYTRGEKYYELSNHLGNVSSTITDRKIQTYWEGVYVPDVKSYVDYYPFGFPMEDRSWQQIAYRYGFNGQENDNEIYGVGNFLNFEFRGYDSRLGRWWSVDPLADKYPYVSPYMYCLGNPIRYVDPDGRKVDEALFDTKTTPNDATLVTAGGKIPTVSNAFQVLAHGNHLYMRNVQNGQKVTGEAGQINSAARFDQAFSSNAEWQKGKHMKGFNLILYACNTGRGENSIASKISDTYEKISVIAPTRQAWISSNGSTSIYGSNSDGSKDLNDPGYWIVYQKGVAVEAYDATWQPGSSTKGHKVDLKTIPESHYKGDTGKKDFSTDKKIE